MADNFICEELHREKRTKNFKITLPDKLGIIKIKIKDIVKIKPGGKLKRTKRSLPVKGH